MALFLSKKPFTKRETRVKLKGTEGKCVLPRGRNARLLMNCLKKLCDFAKRRRRRKKRRKGGGGGGFGGGSLQRQQSVISQQFNSFQQSFQHQQQAKSSTPVPSSTSGKWTPQLASSTPIQKRYRKQMYVVRN